MCDLFSFYRALPFPGGLSPNWNPRLSPVLPARGFAPLHAAPLTAHKKQVDSCTATMPCRARIQSASPGSDALKRERCKTIRNFGAEFSAYAEP